MCREVAWLPYGVLWEHRLWARSGLVLHHSLVLLKHLWVWAIGAAVCVYCITVLRLDNFVADYETLDVGERALFLGLIIWGYSLVVHAWIRLFRCCQRTGHRRAQLCICTTWWWWGERYSTWIILLSLLLEFKLVRGYPYDVIKYKALLMSYGCLQEYFGIGYVCPVACVATTRFVYALVCLPRLHSLYVTFNFLAYRTKTGGVFMYQHSYSQDVI